MARVKRSGMLFGLSGSLGNLVFSQMPDGSTRISVKPDRRRKSTRGQKESQKRFRQAAGWASAAAKDYPIYAELAKEQPMKTAYNIALADCLKPPVIHCVERKDGMIRVRASDNVFVAEVNVKITDGDGNWLEEGEAIRVDEEWWEYATTWEGIVEVVARDLAWNGTKAVL